jgi:hypothetical protein
MKSSTPFAIGLAASLLLASGCMSHDEKPRGAGASGRPLAVLSTPLTGVERFYKFTPEQTRAMELLQQPFDAVMRPGSAANDPLEKATTDKVKAEWNDIRFAIPEHGRYQKYRVVLSTTVGDLVVDTFEPLAPDVVRNFVARAKAGAFNNRPLIVEGDALALGSATDHQAYTLPAVRLKAPLPQGSFFAYVSGDRAAGGRFGISLRRLPAGAANAAMFGYVSNPSKDVLFQGIIDADAAKPGSVMVTSAKVEPFGLGIFEGADTRIPKLDKDGRLKVPDMAMYTGASSEEVRAGDPSLTGAHVGSGTAWIDAMLSDALWAPNIPEQNPNRPLPLKKPTRTP